MRSPITYSIADTQPFRESLANYFGVVVKVVERMENCSLIRYRDRDFVVSSEDLEPCLAVPQAA